MIDYLLSLPDMQLGFVLVAIPVIAIFLGLLLEILHYARR